jgi:hypothetical protein
MLSWMESREISSRSVLKPTPTRKCASLLVLTLVKLKVTFLRKRIHYLQRESRWNLHQQVSDKFWGLGLKPCLACIVVLKKYRITQIASICFYVDYLMHTRALLSMWSRTIPRLHPSMRSHSIYRVSISTGNLVISSSRIRFHWWRETIQVSITDWHLSK